MAHRDNNRGQSQAQIPNGAKEVRPEVSPPADFVAYRKRRARRVAHPLVEMKGVVDDLLLGRVTEHLAVARIGDLFHEAKGLLPEWDSTLITHVMDVEWA